MIAQRSRRAPVEPLSARVLRYRIARGYSPSDLASAAGVWAGAIRRLESGRPVDKRMLAPLAAALGVPLCRLVCGEHSCAQRACAPASHLDPPELPRRSQLVDISRGHVVYRAAHPAKLLILDAATRSKETLDKDLGLCVNGLQGRGCRPRSVWAL